MSDADKLAEYRRFVIRVLGDNECWVGCGGDIWVTNISLTFKRENFDYFHYDPESRRMFVRPTMEMHKTTVDNLESLPNSFYTKQLQDNGTGDVILLYKEFEEEDDDSDTWHVETQKECTLGEFKKEYPNSVSLLL